MKPLWSLLLILCFIIFNKNSALKAQVFDRAIDIQSYSERVFLTETSDSGFMVFTGLNSTSLDATDFYLVKSTASGVIEWKKKYNICSGAGCGGDLIFPSAVHELSDGSFICTGSYYLWSGGGTYEHLYIFRTDTVGNIVWLKRTNTNVNEGYRSASVLEVGNDLILSFGSLMSGQGIRPALMKINRITGDLIWAKNYTSFASTYSFIWASLKRTLDNNLALLLQTYPSDSTAEDLSLIKLDTSGSLIWAKTMGTAATDIPLDFETTSDSGFIIAATGQSDTNTSLMLLKADDTGNVLWTKTFKDTFQLSGRVVHQTNDNGYIVGGGMSLLSAPQYGALLMKTDSIGTPLWTRSFLDKDNITSLSQTSDGGFVFCGPWNAPNGRGLYFTRTDASGSSCIPSILSQSSVDTPFIFQSILQDFTANNMQLSLSSMTFAQIDTGGSITGCGGLEVKPITDNEDYRLKIYPNPSAGKFEINFTSQKRPGMISIKVTNVIGTEVMTEDVKEAEGTFRKEIDLSSVQKGIYFITLTDDQMRITRMVIVK